MAFDDEWELYDILFEDLYRDPYGCGEQHPSLDVRVWESPDIIRLPRIAAVYRVFENDLSVTLWNVCETRRPRLKL